MIRYKQDLVPLPDQGTRPFSIKLRYSLASTAPAEEATVTYTLLADNDTFFELPGQAPAKMFKTVQTVNQKSFQSFQDQVTLVRGAGNALTLVVIQQSISGPSGPPLPDSCMVTVG